MKQIKRYFLSAVAVLSLALVSVAQDSSSSSVLRRGGARNRDARQTTGVTARMQTRMAQSETSDADLAWMRIIYRELDLNKDKNAPLYYPEEPIDGQESLFRMIMRLLSNDELAAYEYLDGREIFSDQYRLKVKDMLDRFHVYYQEAKGSSEKHPKFTIEESDVPANEVLSYYIIERWEFDKRTNRTRTIIEAVCPVLHRSDDFGMEAVKYPMFWVKFDDLKPYMSTQNIFTSDSNNLATYTYDDYFRLGLYEGDIYKTRNLRNKSMAQLYPDPDKLKLAQDSIQKDLETFDDNIWVPGLEELKAQREAKEKAEALAADGNNGKEEIDSDDDDKEKSTRRTVTRRGSQKEKSTKSTKVKRSKPKNVKQAATRSVRNRRK